MDQDQARGNPRVPPKPSSLASSQKEHASRPLQAIRVPRIRRSHPPNLTIEHTSLYSSSSPHNLIKSPRRHVQAKKSTAAHDDSGTSTPPLEPQVSHLVAMGFRQDEAMAAWRDTHNFEESLDHLLAQSTPSPTATPPTVQQRAAMFQNGSRASNHGPIPPSVPPHGSPQQQKPSWQTQQRYQQQQQQQPSQPPPPRPQHQEQRPKTAQEFSKRYPPVHQDDSSSDEDPEVERQQQQKLEKLQEERRKEYLRKERQSFKPDPPPHQTPTQNTSSSWKPLPKQPVDTMQKVDKHRQQGNDWFKAGRYKDAEIEYSSAILASPTGHDILVILYNNRGATRFKMGLYPSSLDDCRFACQMIRRHKRPTGTHKVGTVQIQWSDQLFKALCRMANALEHLGRTREALETYTEMKVIRPESTEVKEGVARCHQKATSPPSSTRPTTTPKPAEATRPAATPTRATARTATTATTATATMSAFPGLDYSIFDPKPKPPPSKAVADLRARAAQIEADEAERLTKIDIVNSRIQVWRFGKDKNLRALLVSLNSVLWPGCRWQGVLMTDLIDPKQCKKTYLRAIAKVHPDKLPTTATIEQRLLASQIFQVLKEAWGSFEEENHL